jgi:8-amino-7-oxononanoate synthase
LPNDLIDFASNDYLGFLSQKLFLRTRQYLIKNKFIEEAATGSRFIWEPKLYQETEDFIANFHQTETALIFNSGCDATIGFLVQFLKRI